MIFSTQLLYYGLVHLWPFSVIQVMAVLMLQAKATGLKRSPLDDRQIARSPLPSTTAFKTMDWFMRKNLTCGHFINSQHPFANITSSDMQKSNLRAQDICKDFLLTWWEQIGLSGFWFIWFYRSSVQAREFEAVFITHTWNATTSG